MNSFQLNEYRFFDSNPKIRQIAYELYLQVKDLPIVSPHGHVDAKLLANNEPFPDPTELIIIPDHYIYRLLYSQGIAMEDLGIPTLNGSSMETDHRKIWQVFGENYYLFAGTPTGAWLNYELIKIFGVTEKLNGKNALTIYDSIEEKLQASEFLPRSLFDRFNIEVLTTTDGAADSLEYHKKIRASGWHGRIIPCFRPDAIINITDLNWPEQIAALGHATGIAIDSYRNYIAAIENRRAYFKLMGAVSTDQGIINPYTHELSPDDAGQIFRRALQNKATRADASLFLAHMLMEMARMSVEDGLVMQIHPGSWRNHNEKIFATFGPDKGCDIPVYTEYTRNLHELLNKYGNDPRFTLVVFTLDESNYSRELAPLAGHYPALKLGAPWWFHDSIQGMRRFRERVTETASIYNTVGFTDDTRAFPSIPARHDLSRRVDCNYLAGLVAQHIIDMDDAARMSRALAYDLAKKYYKLAN